MKIIISGGSGFLGRHLSQSLIRNGHQVYLLMRKERMIAGAIPVEWDGRTVTEWADLMSQMDVVIHLTGKSLASWPWTLRMKRAFRDSRVIPGQALVEAIRVATPRPRLFVQQSGINHYGLRGGLADESTPAAADFLAQLTVEWENATKPVEELKVRRVILRTAVVLGKGEGLLPLMALPARLFLGGPLGGGRQAMPWIHIRDWVAATEFLIENEKAQGAYNLIAPDQSTNAEFTSTLAEILRRPYWFPVPAPILKILLGEMSVLVLEGRSAQPKRLIEAGYRFKFPGTRDALVDLFGN